MLHKSPFVQTKPRLWLIAAGLLVILLLVVIISLSIRLTHASTLEHNGINNSGSFSGTGSQSFAVGPDAQLFIKEQAGNISVFPNSQNTMTIEPRKHGTLTSPDPQSVRILYNHTINAQGNDQITISTDPWFSNTDFYVTIPASAMVNITVNSGSIDVHTGHGLSASTGSGSIALDSIDGATTVSTDSGDVTADTITGPLTIKAQSGSIRVQGIKGQLQAATASGDVIAKNSDLSGHSILQTQSGSVRFDGSIDPNGSYNMQTNSGDVEATLPTHTTFSLDAGTNSGTVRNSFGASVVGDPPHAQLSMHTQSGSIIINIG